MSWSNVARVVVVVAALAVGTGATMFAQSEPAFATTPGEMAFVNVNTITMVDARVRTDQVVVVRRGRIVAAGSRSQIPVPPEAQIIDGRGRYLVPGLTDAHVHLDGDGTARGTTRADFGDAPLYLTSGVTTVINLRGLPEHLEWRRRIENGNMIGPTIYTSGEFVNEPRVHTPAEVQHEIESQARAGFDLIKFHEIYSRESGTTTTTGLSAEAYARMNDAARALNIPLVGHAPVNLGLDAALQARQPLAHLGALSNLYFLPLASSPGWLVVTAAAFAILLVLTVVNGTIAIFQSRRPALRVSPFSRVRIFGDSVLLTAVVAGGSAALVLPGGPYFDSTALRVGFTVLCVAIAVMATFLLVITVFTWSASNVSTARRVQASITAAVGLVLAGTALAFWVPVAWRSSDAGVELIARRLHAAGIPVQTTLVAYDAIGGPGKALLAADPGIRHLRADVQGRWARFAQRRFRGYRYTEFMKKVAGALNRAGVPLMAGTDAMGFPLVTPGSSLHREIALLAEAGLSPYEVLRAATVAPATFLRRETEFGTIAGGRRADLLLVDGNPLEDLTRLRHPVGVMTRGRWYTSDQLQQMLVALDQE